MKIAILDCFAGISGDMTLGALIDCGVPVTLLRSELAKLKLDGWHLRVDKKSHHHIQAKQVTVKTQKSRQSSRFYKDIINLIEGSDLSKTIKENSQKAFTILAKAEAKIHGIAVNKVHFHEVGAIDSIVDLVGSVIGFEYLALDQIYHTAVPLGTGFTNTDHGVIPVPSPAATEILRGTPIVQRESGYEMTTPTGATIVKTMTVGLVPEDLVYTADRVGYGAGSTKTELWPNLLRIIIGDTAAELKMENLVMTETNIDDMNPEIYPFLLDRLLNTGAKDVYLTHVIMKKGRPGVLLSVLSDRQNLTAIEKEIFLHTTTLGVRKFPVNRVILPRTTKTIKTEFGAVKVKAISVKGQKVFRPEFEECRRIAQEKQMSILEVYRKIEKHSPDSDE